LLGNGAWDDAASRAYYAAFHAVGAVLLSRGKTFSRHAQLIGAFNRVLVKTEIFDREFASSLMRLLEDRQSGDYDVIGALTEMEARRDVADAGEIIDAISRYLEK
jgi:uncharacterized protein (UPF0332 family)